MGTADDLLARVAGGAEEGVVHLDDTAVVEAGDGEDGRAQLEGRPELGRHRAIGHRCRRRNRWILPVSVLGSSPRTSMARGA